MAETQRDLVIGEGQFTFIQDLTKGHVQVYCGPVKQALSPSDQPMRYDASKSSFEKCSLDESIQSFVLASEGSYIVLQNPASDSNNEHPTTGSNNRPRLDFGRKIIVPGPANFALWPGQSAQVNSGHRLRSNQYLVVRIYNEAEATKNWKLAIKKPAGQKSEPEAEPTQPEAELTKFVMGQLLIICGTDVSFFIPPTGAEVQPDENGEFVREAVSLERLEWCLLLDEDGNKRYVSGPAVVFPAPTEHFHEVEGKRNFRALELNDDMGIYLKVIADYTEGEREYKAGEELFITGREQRIYYPREVHAIIRYNDRDRVYGTVIAKGEARYVLNKELGDVELVTGPKILLPDPRKQVLVRRVLSERQVSDWFPGNAEVAKYNAELRAYENKFAIPDVRQEPNAAHSREVRVASTMPRGGHDSFSRNTEYTPPRTISLDNRFAGAVNICPWTNFAVMITSKTGKRRVVIAPEATHLAFDETLQVFTLSTGKPKNTDNILRTAYLQVHNNQVSDKVSVVTADMVTTTIQLSYRVTFTGDTEADRIKWFSVPNYVKFLCDHLRSILRNACKRVGVEELNARSTDIIRDAVLGKSDEGGGKRMGKKFEENNMHVYDLEVLDVTIGDDRIKAMLVDAQHAAVRGALDIANKEREVQLAGRAAQLEVTRFEHMDTSANAGAEYAHKQAERVFMQTMKDIEAEMHEAEERAKLRLAEDAITDQLSASDLKRRQAEVEHEHKNAMERVTALSAELNAQADALVKKAGAISPDLIAALRAFGDAHLLTEVSKSMGPLAIMGGTSVVEVIQKLFQGTPLEKVMTAATNGNGKALEPARPSPQA